MMILITDNEGDLVPQRLVIGRRQGIFREENQVLLLEDVVMAEAVVVAAEEVTNTVLAGGKHARDCIILICE